MTTRVGLLPGRYETSQGALLVALCQLGGIFGTGRLCSLPARSRKPRKEEHALIRFFLAQIDLESNSEQHCQTSPRVVTTAGISYPRLQAWCALPCVCSV